MYTHGLVVSVESIQISGLFLDIHIISLQALTHSSVRQIPFSDSTAFERFDVSLPGKVNSVDLNFVYCSTCLNYVKLWNVEWVVLPRVLSKTMRMVVTAMHVKQIKMRTISSGVLFLFHQGRLKSSLDLNQNMFNSHRIAQWFSNIQFSNNQDFCKCNNFCKCIIESFKDSCYF